MQTVTKLESKVKNSVYSVFLFMQFQIGHHVLKIMFTNSHMSKQAWFMNKYNFAAKNTISMQ